MIVPGSQTTLAQLGLPESFTPARLRIPSRMFPAEKKGEWEPLKVRERRVFKQPADPGADNANGGDSVMKDVNGHGDKADDLEEEILYEEDPTSEEGAVYPIQSGRVSNWSCFFALLTHVYNTLSPPFHTPILVILQPAWTTQDHEKLTQFFFEKFKTPAFCLMDSALAVCYAFATSTATVVDVGFGKCDVSAVSDFVVNDLGRASMLTGCGGEGLTKRLFDLLSSQGFTMDMCEQLKRSGICEILPPGTDFPGENDSEEQVINSASAAPADTDGMVEGQRGSISAQGGLGPVANIGEDDPDREPKEAEDEGVLDVASIVASGKTSEWVAKREKEKAEKAAAKKAAADAALAPKIIKLPNSKRVKATLHYNERRPLDELNFNGKRIISVEDGQGNGVPKRQKTPETAGENMAEPVNGSTAARKEIRRRNKDTVAYVRKDIEVGIERFQAASGGILEQIADSIHRCILSVPEISKRSELWDSLIVIGNGSRIKGAQLTFSQSTLFANILNGIPGFREALVATLSAKYLISPSSATIFTSELPSNFTTPVPTGTNTPQPQANPPPSTHHGPGVNPLLIAATTASNHLAPPSQSQLQQSHQQQQQTHQSHSGHSQTPTSIKLAKMPEYFPEWKEVGIEEAVFLGAQVAAKVVFVVDQGLSKGFMSRAEYNELGPQGIHDVCM